LAENPIRLSVIIPVYKVEDYIARCLDSMLRQDFDAWEVIAVDDGSPDGSGKILDQYAARDPRVHVLHKDNGGVSSARNAGLDLAKGEYVGFVDGDDLVLPDMYSRLLKEAEDGDFDLVQCDYHNYFPDGSVRPEHAPLREAQWTRNRDVVLADIRSEIMNSVWTKIIRRECIGSLRFDENLSIAEDALFVFNVCRNIHRAKRVSHPGYLYFQRDASVMHQPLTEKQFGRMEMLKRQMAAVQDDGELYFAAARRAANEGFSLISMVLTQNRFREKLPELRSFALKNSKILLPNPKTGRRLRAQLALLKLCPVGYYSLFRALKALRK